LDAIHKCNSTTAELFRCPY